MIGSRVSRFDVVSELGRGGMGVVFKGRDTQLERFVALKFLSQSLADDSDARARFLQEARAAAALEHINVCSIFEIGESESQVPYIVMGFCDGESLKDILGSRTLELDEVASFARQIASGLAHAHRNGVIHRDLKPGNVMTTSEGLAKIVDFGIANLRDNTTKAGGDVVLGTPAYMSPEQLRGDRTDARTDIWSFGVLAYELLTGRNPFLGGYDQASIYNVLNVDPPRLRDARSDAADWEPMIKKCLDKDPTGRFATFEEVLRAIPGSRTDSRSSAANRFTGYLQPASGRAYVGRVEERAHLVARLSQSTGTTTLVFGESGIGKTHLVSRVVAERLESGGHALWGRCLFNEGSLPYHPFLSALKRAFPPQTDIPAEIRALALSTDIDFRGREALLRTFLSVSEDSNEVLNREQLWHTMLLVYTILSGPENPLYLVVDDLQWADAATLALFCYLARSTEATHIHLLGLYRLDALAAPEVFHESLRQLRIDGLADQLELERFDRASSDALIIRMLDGDAVDEDLKTHLFEQSEGLPLFLAESLNLLKLEKRISKVDGVWKLPSSNIETTPVAARIQDVILQRLEVLDEEDKELLEVAAMEGETFTSEALEACLGWSRIRILKRLQVIEKKHQLIMHEPSGYRFDHTMVRQVIHDGMLPELRQEYHRLIAAALESRYGSQDDHASSIAMHLVAAGKELEAVPYLLRAANRARFARASEQALQTFEELDRIRNLLPEPNPELAMAVTKGLGDVKFALGDVQQASEQFSRYLDLARSSGDLKPELEARRRLAGVLRLTGHLDEATELAEKALALARSSSVTDETILILQVCAEICASRGRYNETIAFAGEALELAAANGDQQNRSVAESILGHAYWHMGAFRRSEEYFAKALDTQRAIGDRLGMSTTLNFRALSLWKLARFEEALQCAQESIDIKRRISLLRAVPGSMNIIGDVYRDAFALDEAIRVHEESLGMATAHENKGGMCDNLRDLGADHLEKGDFATAEKFMRRALALAESSGIKWYETRSCIGLADTLRRTGDSGQAREFAERGHKLAAEINARELLMESKWALAMVQEEPDRVRELLHEALANADDLELTGLTWRIRLDLADAYAAVAESGESDRLRAEALEIVTTIADGIRDEQLKKGFLASSEVARAKTS